MPASALSRVENGEESSGRTQVAILLWTMSEKEETESCGLSEELCRLITPAHLRNATDGRTRAEGGRKSYTTSVLTEEILEPIS